MKIRGIKKRLIDFLCGEASNEKIRNNWISGQLAKLEEGNKILDAGAGELRWKEACSHLRYVSQDFCEYNGAGNTEGLQTGQWNTEKIDIVSDIINIPVADNSFDAILCSEVLEHIPYPEKAIKEFSRILNPGGVLLLTAPFGSLTHFAPYHFASGFNKYWYEKCLMDYGFQIETIEQNGGYFDYLRQEIMRVPSISERYIAKPSFLARVCCIIMVSILERMARKDKDSGELLTFGYMVRAVKL